MGWRIRASSAGLAPARGDGLGRFGGGQGAFKFIRGNENTVCHGRSVLGMRPSIQCEVYIFVILG